MPLIISLSRTPAAKTSRLARPRLGVSVWDDSAVTRDNAHRRDPEAALDEVAEQLRELPRHDIVDQEDLAWSFESGVEVEVEVQNGEPLILRVEASQGFWFRACANRMIRIDPK